MSVEVKRTKSPVVPVANAGYTQEGSGIVYYVRLSNGTIVNKPEDFVENGNKKTEKIIQKMACTAQPIYGE
jgi:hypothetical protein